MNKMNTFIYIILNIILLFHVILCKEPLKNRQILLEPIDEWIMGSSFDSSFFQNNENKQISTDGSLDKKTINNLNKYYLDETSVTNEQFREFVRTKKYITEAELYRWSFVLEPLASDEIIKDTDNKLGRVKGSEHWLAVEGAYWRKPAGPDSGIKDILEYPVTHISWNDAKKYCDWLGRRLPTEEEWEYAARGGLIDQPYPWGSNPYGGEANLWQGEFPNGNIKEDGYLGVCPAKQYKPNGFGFYNMVGNIWEWTDGGTAKERILRGGSFLDSVDGTINHVAAVSTRMLNGPDTGSMNIGFRCASDYKVKEEKDETEIEEL